MRRKALLICSMMLALTLAAIKPIQAQPPAGPTVTRVMWVSPDFRGTDVYHGVDVIAYRAGTDAELIVQVFNDLPKTDFTVYVQMDWATSNVTSSEEVEQRAWYTFTLTIPIPAAANIFVLHNWRIYVRYIDRTVTPAVERWITGFTGEWGSNLAVYSADQVDSQDLVREYDAWRTSYAFGALWPRVYGSASSEAVELWAKGAMEMSLGNQYYTTGSFSEAKTHYEMALNHTVTAVTTDVEKATSFEDAFVGLVDSAKGFLSNQGYATLIVSIGFLFIGIGAMVYLIRRSRPPVT